MADMVNCPHPNPSPRTGEGCRMRDTNKEKWYKIRKSTQAEIKK
jgi:hypothetical protein